MDRVGMCKQDDDAVHGELIQLIYTSLAMLPMTASELEDILTTARAFNSRNAITGLLVYFDEVGEFIQLLEGPRDAVLSLYNDRIKPDARHRSVHTIYLDKAERRICPDWSMSFRVEKDGDLNRRLPVSDFIDRGQLGGDATTMAHKLMISYRDLIASDFEQ